MNDLVRGNLRFFAGLGVILCLTSVAVGAFGAHALNELLLANHRKEVFDLANRYHFYHGLAMIALSATLNHVSPANNGKLLPLLFFSGTMVFSGSLYVLALSNVSWLGAITPLGGSMLIFAWCIALFYLIRTEKK